MKMRLADLKIDPDFEKALPKLENSEYESLDRKIAANGFDEAFPITIWNSYIVDGHNRYNVCKFRGIEEAPVVEKNFDSKEEAVAWIYQTQLSRRNLSGEKYKYYVGKSLEAEKAAKGASDGFRGNQHTKLVKRQIDALPETGDTAERIAKEHGVSRRFVQRAEKFAKGLDAANEVDPEIRNDVLSGKVKAPARIVDKMAKATPEEKKELIDEIRNPKKKEEGVKKDVGATVTAEYRTCRKCGKSFETWMFSGKSTICKPCDALETKLNREKRTGLAKYAKTVDFIKSTDRDTTGSEDNTKAEIDALNANWISSFDRIISTGVYNKETIENSISEFIENIKKECNKL